MLKYDPGSTNSWHERMPDKSAREDDAKYLEGILTRPRSGAGCAVIKHGPGNLRTERLGQQESGIDAVLVQRREDRRRVIRERPTRCLGITEFDQTDSIRDGITKSPDERPVAMDAGQINQSWQS